MLMSDIGTGRGEGTESDYAERDPEPGDAVGHDRRDQDGRGGEKMDGPWTGGLIRSYADVAQIADRERTRWGATPDEEFAGDHDVAATIVDTHGEPPPTPCEKGNR